MCIFISREMAWVRFPYRLRRNGAGKHAPWRDYVAGNMCRARWRLLHARRRLCNAGVWVTVFVFPDTALDLCRLGVRLLKYLVGFVPDAATRSAARENRSAAACSGQPSTFRLRRQFVARRPITFARTPLLPRRASRTADSAASRPVCVGLRRRDGLLTRNVFTGCSYWSTAAQHCTLLEVIITPVPHHCSPVAAHKFSDHLA